MVRNNNALALFLSTFAISSCTGQPVPPPCGPDFSDVDALLTQTVKELKLDGCGLLVFQNGEILHRQAYGGWTVNEITAIASASKWLSGAVVMSLVDEGLLTLDDTTGQWLGWTGEKGTITIRQLFSHTSGMVGSEVDCVRDRNATLAACVAELEALPLIATPGSEFNYGGNSMQVAGRICELAAGKPYIQLFRERLRDPLRMNSTAYFSDTNPWLGGGMISSLDDYGNFLQMLMGGGTFDGRTVLSPVAVEEILRDQTHGAVVGDVPPSAPDPFLGYGIGNWVLQLDDAGGPIVLASPGAFGTNPIIDRTRNLGMVFLVRYSNIALQPVIEELVPMIVAAVDAPRPPCDLDGDADVDISDLATLLAHYAAGPAVYEEGDVDADGDVDISDLTQLLSNFGVSCRA